MKKFLAITLISLALSSQVYAHEETSNVNVISAKGSSSIDVKPDMATVSVAVETEAKKLQDAIEQNNTISKNINTALKQVIGCDDVITTKNFQVNPVYAYDKFSTPKNKLTGYKVLNQIKVKTLEVDKVAKILQTSLDNGANRISSLQFGINNTKHICNGLLEQAATDARKEAETLAKALGVKLKGIKKVSSSCGNKTPRPYMERAFVMADGVAAAPPPVESGEASVTAQVYVDFLIE